MRAARSQGVRGGKPLQTSQGGGQFKLSEPQAYNGEIANIMSLLQPGQATTPKLRQAAQLKQQVVDPTKRTVSIPKNAMSHSMSTFDADMNDDDDEINEAAPAPTAQDDSVYHFRATLGANESPSPNNNQEMIEALKGDIMNLQHALHNERNKGQSSNKVAGAQFRMGGKELPCENCGSLNQSLKKSKETVRSLKLQLDRLQDKYVGLRKSKSFDDSMPTMDDTGDMAALRQRSDEYEIEISRLRKAAKSDQLTIEQLQKMLLDWQLKDEENRSRLSAQQEAEERFEVMHEEQLRIIDKLRADMGTYQLQLEAAELKLSRSQRGSENAEEMSIEIMKLKEHLTEADSDRENLAAQLAHVRRELEEANARVEATENSRQAAVKAKDEMTALRERAAKECVEAKEATQLAQKELQEKEQERASMANELHENKGKIIELANENVALMQEVSRVRRMLQDQEEAKAETQAALERAIAQSVRLCVVAPTVNVHVSDKKMKFRGGLEDKNLKKFLDQEILEKYSLMFKQSSEGTAPDGSTSIQGWLHKLLGEMQKSIEMHVNNAMNSEGP
jgi:DNA repair exonuclease SbcCD ATPase subunit